MKATLQLLIDGNFHIGEYYQNALHLWEDILKDPGIDDIDALAQEISIQKKNFELRCGGVPQAHEIMMLTGIAQCYNECGELCEEPTRLEAVIRALWRCHFGNDKMDLLKTITNTYCHEWVFSYRDLVNSHRESSIKPHEIH